MARTADDKEIPRSHRRSPLQPIRASAFLQALLTAAPLTAQVPSNDLVTLALEDQPLARVVELLQPKLEDRVVLEEDLDASVSIHVQDLPARVALVRAVEAANCVLIRSSPGHLRIERPPRVYVTIGGSEPIQQVIDEIRKRATRRIVVSNDVVGTISHRRIGDWRQQLERACESLGYTILEDEEDVLYVVARPPDAEPRKVRILVYFAVATPRGPAPPMYLPFHPSGGFDGDVDLLAEVVRDFHLESIRSAGRHTTYDHSPTPFLLSPCATLSTGLSVGSPVTTSRGLPATECGWSAPRPSVAPQREVPRVSIHVIPHTAAGTDRIVLDVIPASEPTRRQRVASRSGQPVAVRGLTDGDVVLFIWPELLDR